MDRVNASLGYNYIQLLAVSAQVRERLEEYVGMETYAVRVGRRIRGGEEEQRAHILELEAYVDEMGEKRVKG